MVIWVAPFKSKTKYFLTFHGLAYSICEVYNVQELICRGNLLRIVRDKAELLGNSISETTMSSLLPTWRAYFQDALQTA